MAYTVSEVARLAGVSVRTLHHYDAIGLLSPSSRSEASYRLYERADLERLQQILFFRELGFPLEEVGRLMSAKDFDRGAALRMQRQLLEERAGRLHQTIRAVEAALLALERGTPMSEEKMFEGFDASAYEEEARERWGETKEFQESSRRTARYSKEQWKQIHREGAVLFDQIAARMEAGCAAADPQVLALAEKHRLHVDRWFYPCSKSLHRALGEMYVGDPRFTENIDRVRPGLAAFLRDAFRAADR
jgi:MerR family transcriptional regulator, thiopeptide resistance regulator